MSKAVIVAVLGLLVVLIPFDGLPDAMSTWITIGLGVLIAVLGLLMRFERLWIIRSMRGGHRTDAYSENGVPQKSEEPRD